MGDHRIHDGEQRATIAQEAMVPGAGRRGLDRRRLLGGVVAGATGLLLPGQGAHAQVEGLFNLLPFRWELYNRREDKIAINFYKNTYFGDPSQWIRIASGDLAPGAKWVLESPPAVDGYEPVSRVEFFLSGQMRTLEAINPFVGNPKITIDGITKAPDVGQSYVWKREGEIEVTRRADTKFKEYLVEFNKPDNQQRTKDDKGKNDNNKRQRKRRGGSGGLSDVDRRRHPVDRVLD